MTSLIPSVHLYVPLLLLSCDGIPWEEWFYPLVMMWTCSQLGKEKAHSLGIPLQGTLLYPRITDMSKAWCLPSEDHSPVGEKDTEAYNFPIFQYVVNNLCLGEWGEAYQNVDNWKGYWRISRSSLDSSTWCGGGEVKWTHIKWVWLSCLIFTKSQGEVSWGPFRWGTTGWDMQWISQEFFQVC